MLGVYFGALSDFLLILVQSDIFTLGSRLFIRLNLYYLFYFLDPAYSPKN